jgi:hypothetical protein
MKRRLRRHRRSARKELQALFESKEKGDQHSFRLMALIYFEQQSQAATFVLGPAGLPRSDRRGGCRYVSNCSAASRPERIQSGTPMPR